ncbi:DNA cytosine methyltransferase [Leptolyngbyaceae cyanobacterium UHCC 1019]
MNCSTKLTVIDLFAGCGGMSLGFQNMGFEIAAAFDYWDSAIHNYRQNFNHPIYKLDLGLPEIEPVTFTQFNPFMMIGGPPCQDFSHAGKRNEELGRADLTIAFAKIIAAVKPRFFIMENVDRAARSKRFQTAREIFRQAGYGLTERVLDASLCGVPQKRKRLFVIGELSAPDDFLSDYLTHNLAAQPLSVRQYFIQCLGQELDIQHYYRHPRNYSRRAIYSIDEPSATIRGVNRPIPATYVIHPADATLSKEAVRPLTTRERASIQTFPESFLFSGSKSDLEQLIGNAVPVKLAEYVARAVLDYLEGKNLHIATIQTLQLKLFEVSNEYASSARN